MRLVNIFLGLVTICLAVWLASEGQWWIAIPDGLFGLGVATVAWQSIQSDRHPQPVSQPAMQPRKAA